MITGWIKTPSGPKQLNWTPDSPDIRDYKYRKHPEWTMGVSVASLPTSVDLRLLCPPVYDQRQIGSCTANGSAALFQFVSMKEGLTRHLGAAMPSRRFIYHKEMMYEGDCNGDNGAQVRTGLKVLATVGVCSEADYPYSDNVQDYIKPIPNAIFAKAWWNKAITYLALDQDLTQMKTCLAAGYPFVFGFTVYDSFESQAVANTGAVPMPKPNESVLGGHCVVAVGYDDSNSRFIIRNSWSDSWGMAGYCTMPYQYLTNADLSDDFWTLRMVN